MTQPLDVRAASSPTRVLLERQAARLSGLRSRLLRRADVASRRRVLDLGAGPGVVTQELAARADGTVVALDVSRDALLHATAAVRVVARAEALPFRDGAFDLVFAQMLFLWTRDLDAAAREAVRVLAPGGVLAALEPDFGGAIEEPPALAIADVWSSAITRAGGDPLAGRHLVAALGRAGLDVATDLSPSVSPPDDDRFALCEGLPLTDAERARVSAARRADAATPSAQKLVHVPTLCVLAKR